MGLHAQNHRLKPWFCAHGFIHLFPMEYWIWKENIQNLKHLVVALVVCQLLPILEVQGSNLASSPLYALKYFLGLSFTFITCAYIYDSHLVPIVTITPFIRPSHCTFSISSIPYDFHAIAENLHDTAPHQPSVVSTGLSTIRFGGGSYEVGTVCTSNRLLGVRDGRNIAWHFSDRRSRQ